MKVRALAVVAVAAALGLSSTASAKPNEPQPVVPAGPSMSAADESLGVRTPAEATAVQRWKKPANTGFLTQPATGKPGTVVYGTDTGIQIRQVANGNIKCKYPPTGSVGRVTTIPMVDVPNNRIYFGTETGNIVSVNATTCALRKSVNPGFGKVLLAYQPDVIAASFPDKPDFRGYDPATLAEVWDYPFLVPGAQEPRFISSGIVLVANSPWIDAVDATDGSSLWFKDVGTALVGRAAAPGNGFVYVSGANQSIYQFNVFNGTPGWTRDVGTTTQLAGSSSKNKLVATGANGRVYSLDAATGAINCFAITGGSYTGRAAIDNATGLSYVVNSGNGKLFKLANNCTVTWSAVTGAYAGSGPQIDPVNNAVFTGGNGFVWAFNK